MTSRVEPQASPAVLRRWADILRERGLEDLGVLALRALHVWGFIGGQMLWMLAPLLGKASVAPLAEALENPETLDDLQAYLIEGKV